MITVVNYPNGCLTSVECLEIGFSSDSFIESLGTKLDVHINANVYFNGPNGSIVGAGTIIRFNEAEVILVNGTPDRSKGEVEIQSGLSSTAFDMYYTLYQNAYMRNNFNMRDPDTQQSQWWTGQGFRLFAKDAKTNLTLTIVNPIGFSSPLRFSFTGQPVRVKDNYSVYVYVSVFNNPIGEVRGFLLPVANSDSTNVFEYQLKVQLSDIVKPRVKITSPVLTDSTKFINPIFFGVAEVRFNYAEAYGDPYAIYGYNEFSEAKLFVAPAVNKAGLDLTRYCNGINGVIQDFYTVATTQNVLCKQDNWLYLVNRSTNATYDLRVIVVSLGQTIVYSIESGEVLADILYEIKTGLPQLKSFLLAQGVPQRIFDGIKEYTIALTRTDVNQSPPINTMSYKYKVMREEGEFFLFKNSLGSYQTIPVMPLEQYTLEANREFIENCRPCIFDSHFNHQTIVSRQKYIDLDFFLFNQEIYDRNLLEDFLSSAEVYLCKDGSYYYCTLTEDSNLIYEMDETTHPAIKVRLYE